MQPFSLTEAVLFRKMYWCLPCSSCWVVWCWDTRKSIFTAHPCGAILKENVVFFLFVFVYVRVRVYEQIEVWLSSHPCSLFCLVKEAELKEVSCQLNILFRVNESSIQNIKLIAKAVFPLRQKKVNIKNMTVLLHEHKQQGTLLYNQSDFTFKPNRRNTVLL